jgi:hypothetical protein
MSTKKIVINIFKYLLIFVGLMIVWIIVDDRLWHPLKKDGLEYDLFGGNVHDISIESRVDFIGVDIHGDYFDFYEYEINGEDIDRLIKNNQLQNFPTFSNQVFPIKAGLKGATADTIKIQRWTKTPPIDLEGNLIFELLEFGNFNDSEASKRFVQREYLKQENNFFAYYSGYPQGIYLYVLVPKENRLFIIRNR